MTANQALTAVDAKLLVLTCEAIVGQPEKIEDLYSRLYRLAAEKLLHYTTSTALLRLLLSYVSPVAVPTSVIANLASALLNEISYGASLNDEELIEDIEDTTLWLVNEFHLTESQMNYMEAANELSADLEAVAEKYGFLANAAGNESMDVLFSFCQAKVLQLSAFYLHLSLFDPLFDLLKGYPRFDEWYYGVVYPYTYFWENYASLTDVNDPARTFFSLASYSGQFNFLIEPLRVPDSSFGDKLTLSKYLSNVILPLAVYYDNDLNPISAFLLDQHPSCEDVNLFQAWDEVLRTVINFVNYKGAKFELADIANLVRRYLGVCVYFGVYVIDNIPEPRVVAIQEQLLLTLDYLDENIKSNGESDSDLFKGVDLDDVLQCLSLGEFLESPSNPVNRQVYESLAGDISSLRDCVSLCCSLYPVNSLTLKKYLRLKNQSSTEKEWIEREVILILNKVDTSNYQQLLNSIDLFTNSFITDIKDVQSNIATIIFDKLLQANLFDIAVQSIKNETGQLKVSHDVAYDIILRRFWDLLDNSSNLDDRIGKMKSATECIDVFDIVTQDDNFDSSKRANVTRLKHLLKAFHNLKNFKLVIQRNQPVTPKQMLSRLSHSGGDDSFSPMSLISIVLEQNPKSYLAFQKLHKIAYELAIYLELDSSEVNFFKLQSACIESALVDSNFDFAYKYAKLLLDGCVKTDSADQLSAVWLAFYQVGKFIEPEWFNDYSEEVQQKKLQVLLKQREILSLALKYTIPSTSTTDNSKLLIAQFRHVNHEITKWYEEADSHRSESVQRAVESTEANTQRALREIKENAARMRNQGGKLSDMLVSGLGWAIGAHSNQ